MLDAQLVDKKVVTIHLDTNTSATLNLVDNIRNVVAVKLLKVYLQTSNDVSNLNMYYLYINDYGIVDVYDLDGNIRQAFCTVPFDPNNTVGTNLIASYTSIPTSDYRNDPDCFAANPLISNLSRLSVSIADISGNPPTNVSKFFVELVIYSQFAKITMD